MSSPPNNVNGTAEDAAEAAAAPHGSNPSNIGIPPNRTNSAIDYSGIVDLPPEQQAQIAELVQRFTSANIAAANRSSTATADTIVIDDNNSISSRPASGAHHHMPPGLSTDDAGPSTFPQPNIGTNIQLGGHVTPTIRTAGGAFSPSLDTNPSNPHPSNSALPPGWEWLNHTSDGSQATNEGDPSTSATASRSFGPELIEDVTGPPTPFGIPEDVLDGTKAPSTSATASTSFGPELIEDVTGPPTPFGIPEDMLDDTKAPSTSATASASFRPELIEDVTGPPTPFEMLDNTKVPSTSATALTSVGLELIEDISGPPTLAGITEDMMRDKKALRNPTFSATMPKSNAEQEMFGTRSEERGVQAAAGLELINELHPPMPLNYAESEEARDSGTNKTARPTIPPSNNDREESIVVPTNDEEMQNGNVIGTSSNVANEDPATTTTNTGPDLEQGENSATTADNTGPDLEQESTVHIPEAWAVTGNDNESERGGHEEEPELVMATRALPWWKQRRAKLSFGVGFAILVALSITLGVSFSRRRTVTVVMDSPGISMSPSASSYPSFSPSSCEFTISNNKQIIDIPYKDPRWQIAVDGINMVLVVGDRTAGSAKLNTIFYSYTNDQWVVRNALQGEIGRLYGLAISGRMAFAGFPSMNNYTGLVLVYRQNEFDFWEKVDDPFIFNESHIEYHRELGRTIFVNGNLACIVDGYTNTYLFRKDGLKWVEYDRIDSSDFPVFDVSISGNLIAMTGVTGTLRLYRFDEDLQGIVLLQDPIVDGGSHVGISMNQDYIVHERHDGEHGHLLVYRRDEATETFGFHQQLNISDWYPKESAIETIFNYPPKRALLDGDVLVVARENYMNIFLKENQYWEEAITLEGTYEEYRFSGQKLLATTGRESGAENRIYSFNIEGCIPEPSQMPSLSFQPTACSLIIITVETDDYPEETSWVLQRIEAEDNVHIVKSYSHARTDPFYTEEMCLQSGQYEFKIFDSNGDGLCCKYGEGQYNITTSDGVLIAQGGAFKDMEDTEFSLPFIPAPSAVPSTSISPSVSISPSLSPSRYPSVSPSSSVSPSLRPSRHPSQAPSLSTRPTTHPSLSPSVSPSTTPYPSSGPSSSIAPTKTLLPSISASPTGRQTIDLQLDNPRKPWVAVDGNNMIVVFREGTSSTIHTMFYVLTNNEWVEKDQFQQEYHVTQSESDWGEYFTAISGTTAFVGLPWWGDNGEGAVFVYEQNESGFWEEVEDPFGYGMNSTYKTFGWGVNIDGDLACVADYNGEQDTLYFFHQDDNNKWMQFDKIEGGMGCIIDRGTIALGFYDESASYGYTVQLYAHLDDRIVPLQDPFDDHIWYFGLSGDHLVYSTIHPKRSVFIYHREEANGKFTFQQQLDVPTPYTGQAVAIDKDLLVVEGFRKPHIFSEQNGTWVEILVLGEGNGRYVLSGRNLLTYDAGTSIGNDEIHYYNLDMYL